MQAACETDRPAARIRMSVPPSGLEPLLQASEACALSTELRGQETPPKSPAPTLILTLRGESGPPGAGQRALPHAAPRGAAQPADGRVLRGAHRDGRGVLLREGHHPRSRAAGAPREAAPDHQPDGGLYDV